MNIGIVIATRDRKRQLLATLRALDEQQFGDYKVMVAIVDDGSRDGTVDAVRRFAPRLAVPIDVLEGPRQGVSAARNRAVRHLDTDLVLSLNDDTRPVDPGLVRGHVDAHVKGGAKAMGVAGRIEYPPELSCSPFMAWLEKGAQFKPLLRPGPLVDPRLFYTAHASLPRETWLSVGGMDERMRFGYEDAEFGLRLAEHGVCLEYRPTLRVVHDHPTTLADWRKRQHRMGRAARAISESSSGQRIVAPVPRGLRWAAKSAGSAALERVNTDWAWMPARLRDRIYAVLHGGWYARGYGESEDAQKTGELAL